MSKSIILRPRLSEKTYAQSENRVYVVEIPAGTNKHTVARAVEEQFEVKVTKVNILNVKGKTKRVISMTGKRYTNSFGSRNDIRKAYVTLAEGHSLPFFAAVEQEEAQEAKVQEKVDAAAAKQTAKAEKAAAKSEKKSGRGGFLKRGGARGGDR